MPQGTHLSIRVGRDIFIGTARFSDTSTALWPIVNDFLKNLQGSNLSDYKIVLQGEVFDSAAVKKILARYRVRMTKISRF